jgi:hypothetical protein
MESLVGQAWLLGGGRAIFYRTLLDGTGKLLKEVRSAVER